MHIAEGMIKGIPAIATAGVSLGLVGIGAKQMRAFICEHPQRKPLLGMAGAFIFFISLIPIPAFTGTCSHPCGTPLAGILLGPWIGIALSGLSLLLQAAFFSHGGFSTWGANVLALGAGGALCGWLSFHLARRAGASIWIAGAIGGLIGDIVTYLFSGLILGGALINSPHPKYSFAGYLSLIYAGYLPTQAPIAIGEMLLTGLALHYIHQQRPEILRSLKVLPSRGVPKIPVTLLLIVLLGSSQLAFSLSTPEFTRDARVAAVTPPAVEKTSPGMVGLDEAVNETMARDAGRPARNPYINIEKMGDLWNALLLLAGGICGFMLGRWWHLLFGKKSAPCDQTNPMVGGER